MLLYSIINNIQNVEEINEKLRNKEIFDLCTSEITFFLSEKDLYRMVRNKKLDINSLYILSILVEKEVFEKYLNRNLINKEERSILFTKEMYLALCNHAKENRMFKSYLRKIYQYHEELFGISVFIAIQLQKHGVELNEKYFDYLYEYICPVYYNDSMSTLSMLALYDESNRRLFDSECDKVVVYKETPEIYDNFVDAILSNYNQQYEMNLLSLHNKGIYPQKRIHKAYTNFHVTIKPTLRVSENARITELRKLINHIYRWKNGKLPEKDFSELQQHTPATKYSSVEEFKKQWVKNMAFRLSADLVLAIKFKPEEKNTYLIFDEYVNNLKSLLNRYSQNNKSVFEKVENLNDYDGYTGIYILCFDDEMKMYIGQTKQSFKKRITSHFTKPQSDFDKTHSFDRISSIYILHTTSEFIDYVEADCIANIEPKYLLNKLAASGSIELITSESYNPQNYMISSKAIIDIVSDVEKAKEYNRQNIEWDNWIEEEKKAFNKLKRLKDENKTEDLCLQAVRYSGDALSYVPESLKTEKVCYEAFTHYHEPEVIVKLIPPAIMSESFIIKLIKHNKKTAKILPAELITPNIAKIAKIKNYIQEKKL